MLSKLLNTSADLIEDWRKIPRGDYKRASLHPMFRRTMREISTLEDEENSYYNGILNTIAEHCVGTMPMIMGNHPSGEVNDAVEDKWYDWAAINGIGSAIRQIRRGAARTGLGIGIPYKLSNPQDPIGFGIKTVSSLRLQNPRGIMPEDRIYDGVQYDENWDIAKIFIKEEDEIEAVEYDIKDVLLWFKRTNEDMHIGLPECGPAFCLFPSVKRYMDAIVRGEEFKASIPMAVKLDPDVYRPEDADISGVPAGEYKYEPGMVPTLPPGTELTGLNVGQHSEDRVKFIHLVIAAAARCVQMPRNIALGDSSDSNMATAAIDIQPWVNRVRIDRVDFQPIIMRVFDMWYQRAVRSVIPRLGGGTESYLPLAARNGFTYEINYDMTFEHPDPGKRANARATDLASGSTTLHKVYTDQGLNGRRQLDREAKMLGITRDELNEMIIAKRVGAMYPIEEQTNDQ
jgi:hypothetical protein